MPNWKQLDFKETRNLVKVVAAKIRSNELLLGRHNYSVGLLYGVMEAFCCGYEKIAAVELGVGHGGGLFDLCKAAAYFRDFFEIEIDVYGFDNATGLPPIHDYRDHPEIWRAGEFNMGNPETILQKLPTFGHLIIGDVRETMPSFEKVLANGKLGFVSIDLDYYSSTKNAMGLFEMSSLSYLPAVPMYLDDVKGLITMNPWCGEELAIEEFNRMHEYRKIHEKLHYGIPNFHVFQVLDHPIRNRMMDPRFPLEVFPF
jgi:hypothetical protein